VIISVKKVANKTTKTVAKKAPNRALTSKNNVSPRVGGRELLLQIMIDELDEVGEADVRLETILERAQISPSSMYHHFGNLRGLIEEAHVERYVREIYGNLDELKHQLETIESKSDFVKIVDATLDVLLSEERRIPRFRRANAMGSSYGRPEFARRLGQAEREVNKRTAEVLKIAQYRGFVPRSVDLEAFASWLNGALGGGVVVDQMDDPEFRDRWADMVRASTKYLLGIK
jgi:AcrR family transcriptional regulator